MSKKIYNILTVFLLLLLSDMEAMAGSNPWIDGYTDKKLEEAMVESYGSQAAVELASLEAYKKIAKEYGYSNLATAAIIAQKYMEHKHGFRDVGILGNSEENYYYKNIYKTVTQGIIPETYRCAYLLAKNPQGILYWGGHLCFRYAMRHWNYARSFRLSSPMASLASIMSVFLSLILSWRSSPILKR